MTFTIVDAICAGSAILQAIVATLAIRDRIPSKGAKMLSRGGATEIAVLMVVGMAAVIFLGFWVHYNPPQPKTVIQYVDKPPVVVPCPPSKSGNATSRGANSPANSGSGNTTTIEVPAPATKPRK
jgi:hypothetical protein